MGVVGGGRLMVFGGSLNDSAKGEAAQPYLCDVNAEKPTWSAINARGHGPQHNRGYAWGYSTTMMDDLRFVLLGRYRSCALVSDELYELTILTNATCKV
eukprot:6889754-Pyramimonas_sp.AAC.1